MNILHDFTSYFINFVLYQTLFIQGISKLHHLNVLPNCIQFLYKKIPNYHCFYEAVLNALLNFKLAYLNLIANTSIHYRTAIALSL